MNPEPARREALIRFFVERPSLTVRAAAELLGWHPAAVLAEARQEKALLPGNRVVWKEVAFWLLQAYPREWLLQTLGAHARLIPAELHLAEVQWRLPLYVLRAMERQADAHTMPVEDYIADALHLVIDQETVASLQDDRAFLEAFDYPDVDDADGV
jgi:hypothetical protein